MNINVKYVARPTRYKTAGDWLWRDSTLCIEVVDCGDERSNLAVAIHEIIEAMLCEWEGIKERDVTDFDIAYVGSGEPGSDDKAPYNSQHERATLVERYVCKCLMVDWDKHDELVEESLKEAQPF